MIITVSNTLTIEKPTAEMQMWCKKKLTIPAQSAGPIWTPAKNAIVKQ